MKVLLLTIPICDPTQPSLAVPTLAAVLKTAGFLVEAWDLAIDAFHHLTSPPFLAQASGRLEARAQGPAEHTESFIKKARKALVLAETTTSKIIWAKNVFRDREAFYDYAKYRKALSVLDEGFSLISAAFAPTEITMLKYDLGINNQAATLHRHLVDPAANIFLSYFQEVAAPKIKALAPDLIGLSVTYPSQFPPALTLARVIRDTLPDTPLILGGAYLTAIADRLPQAHFLWELTSGIVFFEGEFTLVEVARGLAQGRELTAPNLWRPGCPLPRSGAVEDMDRVPTPDFSGIPLEKYLTPEPVLPVQSCRGCYWGRCAFCSVSRATRGRFRQRSLDRFFQDLDRLHVRHGARIFFICDDATTVVTMKALAEHIRRNRLPYRWGTEARFETQLDDETVAALVDGGCAHLIFGFESASDRVLSLMRKGTHMDQVRRILQACRKADLAVNLQSFVGFPGETKAEACLTEDFFRQNRELYTSLGLGHFMAIDGSPVARQPEQFGVTLREESAAELTPWSEIETVQGMPRKEAVQLFHTMLHELRHDDLNGPGLFWGSSGAHGLLYLDRYGRSKVDALGAFTNALPGDPGEFLVDVTLGVNLLPLSDSETLIYDAAGSLAEVVGPTVAKAVELIKKRPQSITEAAAAALGESQQLERDDLDSLIELVSTLIYLAKIDILRPLVN